MPDEKKLNRSLGFGMVIIMVMAMQKKVMGPFTLPLPLCVIGWLATLVMAAVVVALFATL